MSPNDGVVSMIGEEWDAARVFSIRCVLHSEVETRRCSSGHMSTRDAHRQFSLDESSGQACTQKYCADSLPKDRATCDQLHRAKDGARSVARPSPYDQSVT
jgi:hypothetical protein